MKNNVNQIWNRISGEIAGLLISSYFHQDCFTIKSLADDINHWARHFWDASNLLLDNNNLYEDDDSWMYSHLDGALRQQMHVLVMRLLRDCHLMIDENTLFDLYDRQYSIQGEDFVALDGTGVEDDLYLLLAMVQSIYQVNVTDYQQVLGQYIVQAKKYLQGFKDDSFDNPQQMFDQLGLIGDIINTLHQNVVNRYQAIPGAKFEYRATMDDGVEKFDKPNQVVVSQLREHGDELMNDPTAERRGSMVKDAVDHLESGEIYNLFLLSDLANLAELDLNPIFPQLSNMNGLMLTRSRVKLIDNNKRIYQTDIGSYRLLQDPSIKMMKMARWQFAIVKVDEIDAILQQDWEQVRQSVVPYNHSFVGLLDAVRDQIKDDAEWVLLEMKSDNLWKVDQIEDVHYVAMRIVDSNEPVKTYQQQLYDNVVKPSIHEIQSVADYIS